MRFGKLAYVLGAEERKRSIDVENKLQEDFKVLDHSKNPHTPIYREEMKKKKKMIGSMFSAWIRLPVDRAVDQLAHHNFLLNQH